MKTPADISFFDRPIKELEERFVEAMYDKKLSKSSVDKYQHAVDQGKYIADKLKAGAVAFYADSTDMVIEKLK